MVTMQWPAAAARSGDDSLARWQGNKATQAALQPRFELIGRMMGLMGMPTHPMPKKPKNLHWTHIPLDSLGSLKCLRYN